MKKMIFMVLATITMIGCAGFYRGCSVFNAESFGSDWVVVQYSCDGDPINAWTLNNVSLVNEGNSDGIYWKDTNTGHLIHISGWYNRVQVVGGNFREGANAIGINLDKVHNGKYLE